MPLGRRRTLVALGLVLLLLAGTTVLVTLPPPGPRSLRIFDPDRVADLELRMWQAYYQKRKLSLFSLLVTMLREQYRYSWADATFAAGHLARAAATFGDARTDYARVLPDLERAYAIARNFTGAGF